MAIEIERKFIFDPEILEGLEGVEIKQGYLQTHTVILLCPCEMLERRMNVRLPVRS